MEYKAATCEKCGAALMFDLEKQMLFCQHCNTPYLIERNQTDRKAELFEKAKKWEAVGERRRAKKCYMEILELDPTENAAWWGLAKITAAASPEHMVGGPRLWYDFLDYWRKVEKTGVQEFQLRWAIDYIASMSDYCESCIQKCRALRYTTTWLGATSVHVDTLSFLKESCDDWVKKLTEQLEEMQK